MSTVRARPPTEHRREEKALRRQIMIAIGGEHDVLVLCNEANVFAQMLDLVNDKADAFRRILPEERNGLGEGSTDLMVCVGSHVIWAEIKTPTGALSPAQRVFRDRLLAMGLDWQLWRSVDEARAAVDEARARAER